MLFFKLIPIFPPHGTLTQIMELHLALTLSQMMTWAYVAFKNRKVHLTGYFEGTANIGGTNITSAGQRDYYFARLTSLGQ